MAESGRLDIHPSVTQRIWVRTAARQRRDSQVITLEPSESPKKTFRVGADPTRNLSSNLLSDDPDLHQRSATLR